MKEFINTPEQFKSEIEWDKWNPDTPKHSELVSEYNEIEKNTKENGTWMKNPNGTDFEGTSEQFVQQQSSWFKKAFPEGFNRTFRGGNNNSTFRGNLAKSDNPRLGSIFAGNKHSAVPKYGSYERIIRPEELGLSHEGSPGYMELAYKPTDNNVNFSAKFSPWNNINRNLLPTEHINMEAITKIAKDNPTIVTTDDISRYVQDKDMDYAQIENIMDGTFFGEEVIYNHKPNNYLKSLWHNVGFFDQNDPSIYK
jgi:hypothetical protein